MFSWFRKQKAAVAANPDSVDASLKPGERFRWPKNVTVTALDRVVLAVPIGLLDPNQPMSEFMLAPDDMQMNISELDERIYFELEVGMSVTLAKTVECLVCGDDRKPRRICLKKGES